MSIVEKIGSSGQVVGLQDKMTFWISSFAKLHDSDLEEGQ